jgi:hypothetical protein
MTYPCLAVYLETIHVSQRALCETLQLKGAMEMITRYRLEQVEQGAERVQQSLLQLQLHHATALTTQARVKQLSIRLILLEKHLSHHQAMRDVTRKVETMLSTLVGLSKHIS